MNYKSYDEEVAELRALAPRIENRAAGMYCAFQMAYMHEEQRLHDLKSLCRAANASKQGATVDSLLGIINDVRVLSRANFKAAEICSKRTCLLPFIYPEGTAPVPTHSDIDAALAYLKEVENVFDMKFFEAPPIYANAYKADMVEAFLDAVI